MQISCIYWYWKWWPKSCGGPMHCWSPNPKVGRGLVSPGPYGCCAYGKGQFLGWIWGVPLLPMGTLLCSCARV